MTVNLSTIIVYKKRYYLINENKCIRAVKENPYLTEIFALSIALLVFT